MNLLDIFIFYLRRFGKLFFITSRIHISNVKVKSLTCFYHHISQLVPKKILLFILKQFSFHYSKLSYFYYTVFTSYRYFSPIRPSPDGSSDNLNLKAEKGSSSDNLQSRSTDNLRGIDTIVSSTLRSISMRSGSRGDRGRRRSSGESGGSITGGVSDSYAIGEK